MVAIQDDELLDQIGGVPSLEQRPHRRGTDGRQRTRNQEDARFPGFSVSRDQNTFHLVFT